MSSKAVRSLVIGLFLFGMLGCATRPRADIAALSTDPVSVDDGSRKVSVSCTKDDTIVLLGDAKFTMRGARGYIGQIESQRGWIEIGAVSMRYDGREVSIRGRKAWQNIILDADESRNFIVDQDGKAMRSIWKTETPATQPAK